MAWKAEYIILLLSVCLINFLCSIRLEKLESLASKKRWLWFVIVFDLSILFLFKYYGFFSSNLNVVMESCGLTWESPALKLLLPMGISFYTFQIMGYVIDVYRGDLKAERNFGFFTLFVTFFPQLVAGPIERASNLIAQLKDLRNKVDASMLVSGFTLMSIGFFKKLVIADRLSMYVDKVYLYPEGFEGMQVLLATFFFAVQIYCDFSGYTDIAIGCALLLGIKLMDNFKSPYFSASISEFWSRWHISLSTWFRDYLYIPLGGNRVVKWRWYYNLYLTFIVSGFWHGANWTFLVWGALHGTYLVSGLIISSILKLETKSYFQILPPDLMHSARVLFTFLLVCFAWIFFRASTIDDAMTVISQIGGFLGTFNMTTPVIKGFGVFALMVSFASVAILMLVESPRVTRWRSDPLRSILLASLLLAITCCFGIMGSKSFIYFQF